MIYFSELKGKKAITEDQIEVGRLEDIIFQAADIPSITKLVVRTTQSEKLIIPVNYLSKLNKDIVLQKEYLSVQLDINELSLLKNILDKQIIDLKGNKVVRVNDVAIQEKGGFYIAGVDIGVTGVLRWLKLENIVERISRRLHFQLNPHYLSWADIQTLELARGQVKLKRVDKKLERLRPEDLADYLEKTNLLNIKRILKLLDPKFAAQVVENLNLNYQSSLFRQFDAEKTAEIINLVSPDDAVDILLSFSTKKKVNVISLLTDDRRKKIQHLLNLSQTPMGDLMTPEYLFVFPNDAVKTVIAKIKKFTGDYSGLPAIYVVNEDNQLVGVFNLHELLLADLDTPIYKFMRQDVVVVHLATPVEIVVKRLLKYKLVALPVIDEQKHILGIITIDDAAKFILDKMP